MKTLFASVVLTMLSFGATVPVVSEKAPEFALSSFDGRPVKLSEVVSKGPVVLVVLRGYPGYQCPFCMRQVRDYTKHAAGFAELGARVILVYPGPPQDLSKRASEFVGASTLPANFELLVDPDYTFTNSYGLRWDAKGETAYPSTFVIDRQGSIRFAKVSREHGGRTTAAEILQPDLFR